MKSWTFLSGGVNWADYNASWARKAPDGSWYVLKFDNMLDAVGETEFKSSGLDLYHCEVKRLDLTEISLSTVVKVLRSYDYHLNTGATVGTATVVFKNGPRRIELSTSQGDVITTDVTPLVLVECLVGYGLGAPLAEFSGKSYPERVRAAARREAEHLMKDRAAAQVALARKVNRSGHHDACTGAPCECDCAACCIRSRADAIAKDPTFLKKEGMDTKS